jgi:hypothetical protein
MLPGAFAQSMPYQPHNDGYRLAFGTEPGSFSDNLSCAQYTEPLKFSPQPAALDQKLDFFTCALQRGCSTTMLTFSCPDIHQSTRSNQHASGSHSSTSSPVYYSCTVLFGGELFNTDRLCSEMTNMLLAGAHLSPQCDALI